MICSNFGRRSDKIVRSKERLARIWLYQRYRVKLFKARKSGDKSKVPCHAYRKHGPQNPLSRTRDRVLWQTGEARAYGMNQQDRSSRFSSIGLMWYARESFLDHYEIEMRERAAAIQRGENVSLVFRSTVRLDKPVGEGFTTIPGGGLVAIDAIESVFFQYRYENGTWYEITGYPSVSKPFGGDQRLYESRRVT